MAADGVGATEWLEMGGEKKPLVMSELGCADGCGRQMGAENCADGCGRRGCNGVAGNGWGEEAAGDERPWLRGRLRTGNGCGELRGRLRTALGAKEWLDMGGEYTSRWRSASLAARTAMGAENWADGGGRRGCKGVAGNGLGEEAAGDERAWLRGRLRMGNGCGELRGRLRTAWVQRSGWLVMSELGCADGCGRRGCKGVAGNGWGEEAAGDERAWLRGRLRTGNGCGELRGRLRTAWVQGSGWKWVGRRRRW